MIRQAIILAGGLGTRLRPAVPDLPKCMAPVAGRPFISYLIAHWQGQGISSFIFALGYRYPALATLLQTILPDQTYTLSVETEPLGTGGALRLAASLAQDRDVLVLNGDSFFDVNLAGLDAMHQARQADCTLGLSRVADAGRYGLVEIQDDRVGIQDGCTEIHYGRAASGVGLVDNPDGGRITLFREKGPAGPGLINGGVYALNRESFLAEELPERFSFEQDYLGRLVGQRRFFGLPQPGYFIDIGTPADYQRAWQELPLHISLLK